jgi:hypothetical protein
MIVDIGLSRRALNASPGLEIDGGTFIIPWGDSVCGPATGGVGRKHRHGGTEDGEEFLEGLRRKA